MVNKAGRPLITGSRRAACAESSIGSRMTGAFDCEPVRGR